MARFVVTVNLTIEADGPDDAANIASWVHSTGIVDQVLDAHPLAVHYPDGTITYPQRKEQEPT
jgi:hypothetical protein